MADIRWGGMFSPVVVKYTSPKPTDIWAGGSVLRQPMTNAPIGDSAPAPANIFNPAPFQNYAPETEEMRPIQMTNTGQSQAAPQTQIPSYAPSVGMSPPAMQSQRMQQPNFIQAGGAGANQSYTPTQGKRVAQNPASSYDYLRTKFF